MPDPDLTLNNCEILPISPVKFGAVVTEDRGAELQREGYKIKKTVLKEGEEPTHYLEVLLPASREELGSFDLATLEWAGRASIVISPRPWRVGRRSGIKAYIKTVTGHIRHACVLDDAEEGHAGDHVCACGKNYPKEDRT